METRTRGYTKEFLLNLYRTMLATVLFKLKKKSCHIFIVGVNQENNDVSVIAVGYMVIEAMKADVGWKSFGISGELSAFIAENAFDYLKQPVVRVGLPDTPAPAARTLEEAYYPRSRDLVEAVKSLLRKN
jgi:pyruvate/2-oxoglutarate/acetoin dehydrogenase E1 component